MTTAPPAPPISLPPEAAPPQPAPEALAALPPIKPVEAAPGAVLAAMNATIAANGGEPTPTNARPILKVVAETAHPQGTTPPEAKTTAPEAGASTSPAQSTDTEKGASTIHIESAEQTAEINKLFTDAATILLQEKNPGMIVAGLARNLRGDTAIGAEARHKALTDIQKTLQASKAPIEQTTELIQQIEVTIGSLSRPDKSPFAQFLEDNKAELTKLLGSDEAAVDWIQAATEGKFDATRAAGLFEQVDSPLSTKLLEQLTPNGEAPTPLTTAQEILTACGITATPDQLKQADAMLTKLKKDHPKFNFGMIMNGFMIFAMCTQGFAMLMPPEEGAQQAGGHH